MVKSDACLINFFIDLFDTAQLEFLYNTQDTRANPKRFDGALDMTIDYWQVSMLWSFNPYEQFNPYFVVGLGATSFPPRNYAIPTRTFRMGTSSETGEDETSRKIPCTSSLDESASE